MYSINFRTREASSPLSRLSPPATVALAPFAADPSTAIRHMAVAVGRPAPAQLLLDYELSGNPAGLRLPAPAAAGGPRAEPTDGLWRHTCMELFVGLPTGGPYLEFNLAPDGRWAAYRFSGYRAGMAPLTGMRPPRIEFTTAADRLQLRADVELPAELAATGLRLGLAAVIEEASGALHYWALSHVAARPDFHRPESFGFEI